MYANDLMRCMLYDVARQMCQKVKPCWVGTVICM
jgi:hypothetical protein